MYSRHIRIVGVSVIIALLLGIWLVYAQQPTDRGIAPTSPVVQPPNDPKHLWRQELRLQDAIQIPTVHNPLCVGDVNGDGVVDQKDLLIVQSSIGKKAGQPGYDARADMNGSGKVSWLDMEVVKQNVKCRAK